MSASRALSSYYYWGSYGITGQNSSASVCKSARQIPESASPAKVFTANNLPYCVNHLDRLPSPTETFVRNFGARLHHIALPVKDGERGGKESIEYVQRYGDFQGFFARDNVALLTAAAGAQESMVKV